MQDLESDLLERTVSTNDTDKFCEAICAFSNDFPNHRQPGYLLIGVDNRGIPSGLTGTDQFLSRIGGIRSDGNVQPISAISVAKFHLPEGDVVVVEVLPSDLPPVRYKGRIYIRVGPRRAVASETEERILAERRVSLSRTFDAQPCNGCGFSDLVLELFALTYRPNAVAADVLQQNHRDMKEQMAALRFFDLSRDCATNAGTILFAKKTLNWLPGAYVIFLRLAGEKLTDRVLDERHFSGDLLTVLRELDAFLPVQIQSSPARVSALREQAVEDYPLVALRELLMNAIMHRDYASNAPVRFYWFSDRVEIQNPGGLYGGATPENFPKQNDYRNPVIAESMKTLGYVNKYGRGVLAAQESLAANSNPPAQFLFEPTHFLVVVRRRP